MASTAHGGYLFRLERLSASRLTALAKEALVLGREQIPGSSILVSLVHPARIVRLAYRARFTERSNRARWYLTHHALARLLSSDLSSAVHVYALDPEELEEVTSYGKGRKVRVEISAPRPSIARNNGGRSATWRGFWAWKGDCWKASPSCQSFHSASTKPPRPRLGMCFFAKPVALVLCRGDPFLDPLKPKIVGKQGKRPHHDSGLHHRDRAKDRRHQLLGLEIDSGRVVEGALQELRCGLPGDPVHHHRPLRTVDRAQHSGNQQ